MFHTTVLLNEGVEALNIMPDGVYVDATYGGGGHARAVLDRLGDKGVLLAFDQDAEVAEMLSEDGRLKFYPANFRFLKRFLLAEGIHGVDGILADLGVSGRHFDAPERGFSFRYDAELDMRMNRSQPKSAREVLNTYSESELRRVFKDYGETAYASRLARAVVKGREAGELKTTGRFTDLVEQVVPRHKVKGELPKVFQAIRIEVNDELGALKQLLSDAAGLIKPGGRLVVISYHSLEDRLVKYFLRSGNFDDRQEKDVFGNTLRPFDPLGKPITPTPEEIKTNPRARSAKLRIGIKRP
ncbi:MAG: 16S rRNA (cytosine(1402)-N(4))-methyltransferase RsmH [Salibacteraceae bacterium]